MNSKQKLLRCIEFGLLFCIGPLLLYRYRLVIAHKVVILMVFGAAAGMVYLWRHPSFDQATLWRWKGQGVHLRGVVILFLPIAACLSVAAYFLLPEHFLAFPSTRPAVWLLVLLLYPILAAFSQEIIFRGFFFLRYRMIFPNLWVLVAVNGVCFGWAHILYGNWVAPVLSMFGGWLFAYRYARSGSLATVSIEHGLWGNFLFTVGIGWFFYSGAIQ